MDSIERTLRRVFGHERFLGPQRAVVEHLLAGGDALVVQPTGSGKSICYQVPALHRRGVAVVLSPLIALMQDQVDRLRRLGVPATFVNSSLSREERERRTERVRSGDVKLLYVTPERFRKPEFVSAMAEVPIALLAVDEAHCVAQWGHDFRPDYGRVDRIRDLLGRPPTIALTATATPRTQRDILERVGIPRARVFLSGIDRPNLRLAARVVDSEEERRRRLLDIVRSSPGPGIVYFSLIQDLLRFEGWLLERGVEALVYHGDLSASERRAVQRRFLESDRAVVLATNAFGMGIDKPDIRFVAHAQAPGSLEALCQEFGRAGRDGLESLCELVYFEPDLQIQRRFVEWKNPDGRFLRAVYDTLVRWGERVQVHDLDDLRDTLLVKNRRDGRVETALALLEAEGIVAGSFASRDLTVLRPLEAGEEERLLPEEKRRFDLLRLLDVVRYVREAECRRAFLDSYFGLAPRARACGACDLCGAGSPFGDAQDAAAAAAAPRADAPVRVGEWIEVEGRFPVAVRSVARRAGRWIVRGQSGLDLKLRTYDLGRVRWRPLPR